MRSIYMLGVVGLPFALVHPLAAFALVGVCTVAVLTAGVAIVWRSLSESGWRLLLTSSRLPDEVAGHGGAARTRACG